MKLKMLINSELCINTTNDWFQKYKELTSRRVLTMEWINGTKLTNLRDVKKLGIDPDKMIDIGVQCSLEQLWNMVFSCRPHPEIY